MLTQFSPGTRLTAALLLALASGCAGPRAEVRQAPAPTAEAPAPGPLPEAPTLRLGDAARPERYRAELAVDPTQDTFRGAVEIDVELARPTTLLWLNGAELTVEEASFLVGGEAVPARAVAGNADVFGLVPARELPAGPATVRITYTGQVSARDSQGVFRQQDGDAWYAFTQFEPSDARRTFPSFDEPAFKVPFQLTLRVPPDHLALSNTPVESEQTGTDGRKVVRFKETLPLPTYLVAFAVGPFEVVDAGVAGARRTPLRMVVPRGHAASAAWAVKATAPLLEVLEAYFGTPYPYEKLDTLAVPITTGWGAMENPGLITFGLSYMLARPGTETEAWRREFAIIQAHEMAHQWFGNLVTPAWWDDIWLNESFASWMERKAVQRWRPDWRVELEGVRSRAWAMGADSLTTARRIRQPIRDKGDIEQAFDAITYTKGALVLDMFEAFLGEDTFRKGVQEHLRRHAHGVATAEDFFASVSALAGRDVRPLFSSFVDQPGVPRVSVALTCEAGRTPALQLTQERYLPVGSKGRADQRWNVPVCVRYGRGKQQAQTCTLLADARGTLELPGAGGCPEWVVPNAGMRGYVRAHLQGALLARLTADGGRRLTLAERVGLLDDVQALTRSGDLPAGEALALVSRLARGGERDLLTAAAGVVASVREDHVPERLRANWARYVRRVFGERARRLGLTPRKGEGQDTALLRPVLVRLVMREGQDPALRAEARRLAAAWLVDRGAVAPELLEPVLEVAVEDGDAPLQERLLAAARETEDRQVRTDVLAALAAVKAPGLAERNLKAALASDLDVRDTSVLLSGTLHNPSTRDVAYRLVKERFDALVERLPRNSGAHLVGVVASFCDAEHRADAADFFGPRAPRHDGGPRMLAQALERVDLCIAQKEAQAASLATFLERE